MPENTPAFAGSAYFGPKPGSESDSAQSPENLMVSTETREEKERNKSDNPREGWEDGTPPPHRDFKERGVMR